MKVLIDTNAFLIPHQFGVDLFGELKRLGYDEWLVPGAVIKELEKLALKAKGKDKIAAKVGIPLSKRCKIIETEKTGHADDIILGIAVEQKLAVCTSDSVLKKKLSNKDITIIYLRQTHRLSI